jgi:hypothetical protein
VSGHGVEDRGGLAGVPNLHQVVDSGTDLKKKRLHSARKLTNLTLASATCRTLNVGFDLLKIIQKEVHALLKVNLIATVGTRFSCSTISNERKLRMTPNGEK